MATAAHSITYTSARRALGHVLARVRWSEPSLAWPGSIADAPGSIITVHAEIDSGLKSEKTRTNNIFPML